MSCYRLLPYVLALGALEGGCIELQHTLQGTTQDSTGGDLSANGEDDTTDGQTGGNVPVVTLSVSNPVPQVNEQVVLTCSVISGDTGGVTFDFQPATGRLIVNRTTGTASFIVQEVDIGATFAFTCTAANDHGTSEPSNNQMIIPTQW